MRRTFGLRLFFIPATRERLGTLLVGVGLALYALRGIAQLASLRSEIRTADFPVFYQAALDLNAGRDPYTPFLAAAAQHCPGFQWCLGGYIYPPLLAEALRPLTGLGVLGADAAWTVASHLMLVGAAYATYRAVGRDLPRGAGRMLLAASLLFLPLYQNLFSGSVGALLLLVLGLAAWALVAERDGLAGGALAVGAVLRVSPLAITPVLVRRRQDLRRPYGLIGLVVTGLALMAALALLTPYTIEYLVRVLPKINGGTDFVSNVSLPGVLLRFEKALLGSPLPWSPLIGSALAAGVLGFTWWSSRGLDDTAGRASSFAAFLAATSLVSSVTWNYHLVNELLVLALLAPRLSRARHATWMAVAAYPLLWIYSDGILAYTGWRPGGLGPGLAFLAITSLNAVGMLLLWLACLDVLAALRQEGGTEYSRAAPLRATTGQPLSSPGSRPPKPAS